MENNWISVEDELPKGDLEEKQNEITVIGFSEKWVHPDFNPLGQRMCCLDDFGWYSSRWNASNDCYMDVQPDENDNPTHWMPLPNPPKTV